MQIRTRYWVPIFLIAAGCEANGTFNEQEIEGQQQALTGPASGVLSETGSLVTGLSKSTYRDVASSSTNFYVLTNTGVKRVAHSNYASIPKASNFKNISLNCIDYVNSTWNLVGARNKSGSTRAQLVLKIENSSPTTLNLPTDVTTVYDMEAQPVSAQVLEIWITTNYPGHTTNVIREFRYSGSSLTAIQQIPLDSNTKPGITAEDALYLVGMNANSGYPAFLRTHTSSPFSSLVENQQIAIDNDDIPSLGTTSIIYSHGYDTPQLMGLLLYPDKIDWAAYSDGTSYYVMLTPAAGSTYDLVQLAAANVIFDKTPAREFEYWNDFGDRQGSNNCYNYGNNRNTMNFAQPGEATNHPLPPTFVKGDLQASATSDGLEYVAGSDTSPKGGPLPTVPEGKSLVAAIVGWDYHWFRLDRDGRWTHKPGSCQAMDKRYDNARYGYYTDNPAMTDPRDPTGWDSGEYNTFAGFFLVDSNYFQGMGRENVQGSDFDPHGAGADCIIPAGMASTSSPSAASAASAATAITQPLVVTIGLHSGLPNPQLVITDAATVEQVKAIYSKTKQLSGAPSGALAFSGYTGIMVTNPCEISGLPAYFTIFNNHITVSKANTARSPAGAAAAAAAASGAQGGLQYFDETTSSLETFLLDEAAGRGAIDGATRNRVSASAGK